MKKAITGVMASCMVFAMGITMVYAGTSYSDYNTTVGRVNGSGYTGYQTKAINGANADLDSQYVGGKYKVDARMIETDGTKGKWERNIDDNDSYELDGHKNHKQGDSVRVQFSNDLFTTVNVQVVGEWKSN